MRVLAGDFANILPAYRKGALVLTPQETARTWKGPTTYRLASDVVSLDVATEAAGVGVFGAVGWGAVGALLAGPVGAVVGGLLGGRKERVAFVAEFKDGRRLMAETDKNTWLKMQSERFK